MEMWAWENAHESTKIFFGAVIVLGILFLAIANLYFWISEKIKKNQ